MALREIPPGSAWIGLEDRPPNSSVRFRMWQIFLASLTLMVTAWCWTVGPLPGLIFSFLAKHILVGIYAAGLHYDRGVSETFPKKP